MEKKFVSKALEANLAETRYRNIKIPADYQSFINLSKKYYGIHKRANDCIIEYKHPFSNKKFVIEELRKILITDYWFYIGLEEPEKAFRIPLKLLGNLLNDDQIDTSLKTFILRTLLEFTNRVYKEKKDFQGTLLSCCNTLHENFAGNRESYIEASRYFKRYLKEIATDDRFRQMALQLMRNIFEAIISFWEDDSRVEEWIKEKKNTLKIEESILINEIGKPYFEKLRSELKSIKEWQEMVDVMPDFDQVGERFSNSIALFPSFIEKFYFIFYLLRLQGMHDQKERLIWRLNKMLVQTMKEIKENDVADFIDQLFLRLEDLKSKHTSAVLDILFTVGKKVIDIDHSDERLLITHLENKLIHFGFETPGVVYVNEDWQLHVNENHIKNIRIWLELIEYSQSEMENLLSALIVNLKLGGIFISDTDLFQREITKVLNSNIAPFYKKVKQLTRIFPVYFNEIGAEGEIRKVTTTMDEISHREDKLIHFLRKQVHTESNNTLIDLTYRIFHFWYDGNLENLRDALPQNVYNTIDKESRWYAPVHKMVRKLCSLGGRSPREVLSLEEQ
ncbi:Pyruvate,phosphate dikinase, partial [hydrothermal vent metagenome]